MDPFAQPFFPQPSPMQCPMLWTNPMDGNTYPVMPGHPLPHPHYYGPPMPHYDDASSMSLSSTEMLAMRDELTETCTKLRTTTTTLHTRDVQLTAIKAERDELKAERDELKAERDELRTTDAAAIAAKQRAEKIASTVASLEAQLSASQRECDAFKQTLNASRTAPPPPPPRVDGRDRIITDLKGQLKKVRKELRSAEAMLTKANTKVVQLKRSSDKNAQMLHAKVTKERKMCDEFEQQLKEAKDSVEASPQFVALTKKFEEQRKLLVQALVEKAEEVRQNQELRVINEALTQDSEAKEKRAVDAETTMVTLRDGFTRKLEACKKIASDVHAAKNAQLQVEIGRLMLDLQDTTTKLRVATDEKARLVSSTRNPLTDAFVFSPSGTYDDTPAAVPVTEDVLDESSIENPDLRRAVTMLKTLEASTHLPGVTMDAVKIADVRQRLGLAELALNSNTRSIHAQHSLASMANQVAVAMCMAESAKATSATTDMKVMSERLSGLVEGLVESGLIPVGTAPEVAKARVAFSHDGVFGVQLNAVTDAEATFDISHMRYVMQCMISSKLGALPPSLMALINSTFMTSELLMETVNAKMTIEMPDINRLYNLRNVALHTLVLFFVNRIYAPLGNMSMMFLRCAAQLVLVQDQGEKVSFEALRSDFTLWHQLLAISTVVGMSNLSAVMGCTEMEAADLKAKFLEPLQKTWDANKINHTITGDAMALVLMLCRTSNNLQVVPSKRDAAADFANHFFWGHVVDKAKTKMGSAPMPFTVMHIDDTMLNNARFMTYVTVDDEDSSVSFDYTEECRETSNAAMRLHTDLFDDVQKMFHMIKAGAKVTLGEAGQGLSNLVGSLFTDPRALRSIIGKLMASGDPHQMNYAHSLKTELARQLRNEKKMKMKKATP